MNELTKEKINEAYKQLRHKLFCEKTGLIYDSISSHDPESRFAHLPYPEEIQNSIPNPHGYATGMEDCMLNAGFAIEMCLLRYEYDRSLADECQDFLSRLISGMFLCADIHNQRGYVVRGVCPSDCYSYYIESSRDQFTLFVYGLWRYYHSSFASSEEKNKIKDVLTGVAEFVLSSMEETHQYNLGRLDGYPGMHLKMLEVGVHEALRLPMFFAAAFDVTRKIEFQQSYEKYIEQALYTSQTISKLDKKWWHIELSQMQFSLKLCLETETNCERKQKMRELMHFIARKAEKYLLEKHFDELANFKGSWSPLAHPWREAEKFSVSLFEDKKEALRGGKIYLKGEESEEFKTVFELMRSCGNLAVTAFLSQDYYPDKEFMEKFIKCVNMPEYKYHTSGALVNLLCAYFLLVCRT